MSLSQTITFHKYMKQLLVCFWSFVSAPTSSVSRSLRSLQLSSFDQSFQRPALETWSLMMAATYHHSTSKRIPYRVHLIADQGKPLNLTYCFCFLQPDAILPTDTGHDIQCALSPLARRNFKLACDPSRKTYILKICVV